VLSKFEAARKTEPVEEPKEDEVETTPSNLSTKLGGLRNLLFVMGMKRQKKAAEEEPVEAAPEPPAEVAPKPAVEATPKRPIVVRTITGSTETIIPVVSTPTAAVPANMSAPVETATAQNLVREETGKGIAENLESSRLFDPAHEDEDMGEPDDVQILPSWRGQYKKTK
jgi:hypothetical protein